jgi:predicted ArsR family transcriptional regulator
VSASNTVDRAAVRRAIRDHAADADAATWGETKRTVADRLEVETDAVRRELAALERAGFVYTVGDGESAEVKLP